jgi:hypothetical protein
MLCQCHSLNTCLAHNSATTCTPLLRVPARAVLAPSRLYGPRRPVRRGPLRRASRLLLVRATGAPGVFRGRPLRAQQPAVHARGSREAEVVVMTSVCTAKSATALRGAAADEQASVVDGRSEQAFNKTGAMHASVPALNAVP